MLLQAIQNMLRNAIECAAGEIDAGNKEDALTHLNVALALLDGDPATVAYALEAEAESQALQ